MSIASELQQIVDTKDALKQALDVPDGTPFAEYPSYAGASIEPMVLEFVDGSVMEITQFGYYPEQELEVGFIPRAAFGFEGGGTLMSAASPNLVSVIGWGGLNELVEGPVGLAFVGMMGRRSSTALISVPSHAPEWLVGFERMFMNATSFNQDLSGWCVSDYPTKPTQFDEGASSWEEHNKPVWGTCP